MITSSPNSYLTTELTLLLQQDLDSELGKPRTENLGAEVCDKRQGALQASHSPPPSSWERRSLFLPAAESLWGLLGHWVDMCCLWGAAGCVVLAEVTSH